MLGFFKSKKAEKPKPKKLNRSFISAKQNNLTNDFKQTNTRINDDIRSSLELIRGRSRFICLNNDYAKKYLNIFKSNVIGPVGFTLVPKSRDDDGSLDVRANNIIAKAWLEFCTKENFTVTKKTSFFKFQNIYATSFPRDGEFLVRKVFGANNKFSFSLQILDPDYLDETYNEKLNNGNYIKLGIEFNEWGEPVRYHFKEVKTSPTTMYGYSHKPDRYTIDASEIIHVFMQDEGGQVRGYPHFQQSLIRLNMISAYEEAEVVAARIGASKMGFFTEDGESEYTGDEVDDDGSIISDAEPGIFERLPKGVGFESFEPDHPGGNYAPFIKQQLRGLASGMNVQYNSLANDLEGVNFSSIRSGVLEERDNAKSIQKFTVEEMLIDIFDSWLRMALLTQAVKLPLSKIDKFKEHLWKGRTYQWVDPKKDIEAQILAIKHGLKSRTDISEEFGTGEMLDTFSELSEESKLAERLKISIDGEARDDGTNTDDSETDA